MNRSVKELIAGGRNTPAGSQQRRGRSVTVMSRDTDENLDLFSKNRDSLSDALSDNIEVPIKLGKLLVGSAKVARSDLLNSIDGGKHDYDWLLTPPGTPIYASSEGSETHQTLRAPRSSSVSRTASTTKASRLSVTQSESNHSSRARSSSVTRPALSNTQHSTYSSNKSSSILNTSSASISSYIRPSSPITHSPITRPTTPSSRSTSSRSSTSSSNRAPLTSAGKTRPSQISRPSTPTSRPNIAARTTSRPSTPTRRNSTPSSSPASVTTSAERAALNRRTPSSVSRPSSPGSSQSGRPLSAGRSRPGLVIKKTNTENHSSMNLPRRQPSPGIARGRLADPYERASGQPHVSETASRKPVKTSTVASESNGFGRNIAKKSLNIAVRPMDVKNGTVGARPHLGTTLFPQSIKSSASKTRNCRALSAPSSVNGNDTVPFHSFMSENGNSFNGSPENGIMVEKKGRNSSKLTEIDIYESSRYDAILLKEDLKSTNWLHSVDDLADHGLIFDTGLEFLPEPFSPL